VAFQVASGVIPSEISVFMWTDSDVYLAWGREAFGWPLVRGTFRLSGALWGAVPERQATPESQMQLGAAASVEVAGGSLGLTNVALASAAGPGVAPAEWIVPRRLLLWSPHRHDYREILVVSPRILAPGDRFEGSAELIVELSESSPLHGVIHSQKCEVVAASGFKLLVGADIRAMIQEGERSE